MPSVFPSLFMVSQQPSKSCAGSKSPTMSPVINAWDGKTKDNETQYPSHGLPVNRLAEWSPAGFPKVQGGSDEAADGCRSPDGHTDPGNTGQIKSGNAAQGIDDKHPVNTIGSHDQMADLNQGRHVEYDV